MDGQEYLNQISASTKPTVEIKKGRFWTSKYFLLGMGALAALIVIIIIGAIISGTKVSEKDYEVKLLLHLDNTTELVDKYQPNIKSSKLRASSASLSSVLSETSKPLKEYLEQKYGFKNSKDADADILEEANTEKDGLENELFEAKINGVLDMTFAHKMAYEATMIMMEENKIINLTKNDSLKDALKNSHDSLENLYNDFNDFSETKN